jgi:hypothetical protein
MVKSEEGIVKVFFQLESRASGRLGVEAGQVISPQALDCCNHLQLLG